MVRRGLAVRESDPADGRGTQIRLTPEGISLAEQAVKASSAAHHELWADVPDEAVGQAAKALRALKRT